MPNPILGVAKVVAKKLVKDSAKKSVGKVVKGSDVAKAIKKVNAKTAKTEAKANARGLKAANKPVSKNNAGVGGPKMEAILKRATPARTNRTRLGKSAFKSK